MPDPETNTPGPDAEGDEHRSSLAHEADAAPANPSDGANRETPPFDARRLRWQVTRDRGLRIAVILVVLGLLMATTVAEPPVWVLAALVGAIVAYVAMMMQSAKATAALAQATVATETDPSRAESTLSDALKRTALVRSLRLLLYHRLAMLRHRQGRYDEAARICDGVLAMPLGRASSVQSSLLLLLCESRLETRDLLGAYAALRELYGLRIGLTEALQRLLLRTRYEVMAGYDAWALDRLESRLELAEVMPHQQGAAMHALLALAAERCGSEHAPRLRARAELLCPPRQLEAIRSGGRGGVGARLATDAGNFAHGGFEAVA